MRQFYEQQSGQSYSACGQVAGWYTASTGTPPTTALTPPFGDHPKLVKEALIQVAGRPCHDPAQFDPGGRHDLNG